MLSKNKFVTPEEQILALKISFLVLIGLFLCFFSLIFINGLYLLYSEKIAFSTDLDDFRALEKNRSYTDAMFLWFQSDSIEQESKALFDRLSQDLIIIRNDGKVQKNGYFNINNLELELLQNSESWIYQKKIWDSNFLIYRFSIAPYTIFFSRDVSHISSFQANLVINALLLALLFFLIVYIISVRLAKITLAPIKKANQRLKEYNHYVAHELKTPLSVLKSNIELLELTQDEEIFSSSKEEIDGMQKIINGLLFISEKSININRTKINITEIIESIIKRYKNVAFTKTQESIFVNWDSFMIERMITNLVENAQKYSPQKSTIYIDIYEKKMYIKNSIEWELSEENISKLLEPFYQPDTSRNTQWHGLWLAIVKSIVDMLERKISIKKEGEMFCVTINF